MTFPYKVAVKGTKNDINVVITPQPVATSEDFLPAVTKRFQAIIVEHSSKANTMKGRAMLKTQLIDALMDFHKQDMIKPKEE